MTLEIARDQKMYGENKEGFGEPYTIMACMNVKVRSHFSNCWIGGFRTNIDEPDATKPSTMTLINVRILRAVSTQLMNTSLYLHVPSSRRIAAIATAGKARMAASYP